MRNRRYRAAGNHIVVHITNRTIVGLPFRCRRHIEMLILGILGKAQSKYKVNICHFQWMGNHYHIILAGAAKHISPFMNILDGEIAKFLKRLYPRLFQTKVWQGRFKEQPLLTPADVKSKIAYSYANPSRAGLTDKIEDWPGVTSWSMYKNGTHRLEVSYIRPSGIKRVFSKSMDFVSEYKIIKKLCTEYGEKYELVLTPDAWRRCFKESESWSASEIFNDIEMILREREEQFRAERNGSPAGRKALKAMGHRPDYTSKTKSRTPFVICSDEELRKEFISMYRDFCEMCLEAWQLWSKGLISKAEFPRGAYRPGMSWVQLRV